MKDFRFVQIFNGEYYFEVSGDTQKMLNEQFSDMGFRLVNAVVYNPKNDELKAECFYDFNVMYYSFDNEKIQSTLKKIYIEMKSDVDY